jgi:hypothetical protein
LKIRLEITGGFTGPAGKQVVDIDLDQLPEQDALRLRRDIALVSPTIWGGTFLAAHPKSSDFRHLLRLTDDGPERSAVFHRGQAPAALLSLVDDLLAMHAPPDRC